MENKNILIDSDEAATYMTVEGWVSRHGRFYGKNEEFAKYDGCTHRYCKQCGTIIEKSHVICKTCIEKGEDEKYFGLKEVDWDGILPLYSDSLDKYYFPYFIEDIEYDYEDDVYYKEDISLEEYIKKLKLYIAEPYYCSEIDPKDYYINDLPENEELPLEIEEAFRILNEAIKKCKTPICYYPTKKRVSIESIKKYLNYV